MISTDNKFILYLSGGIGNQLFQYAYAVYISRKYNATFEIENKMGFLLDKKYKRKFLLKEAFDINIPTVGYHKILKFLIYLITKKFLYKYNLTTKNILFGISYFNDNNTNVKYFDSGAKNVWLSGYWQNNIFINSKEIQNISSTLKIRQPICSYIKKLGKKMNITNSVALGIRLFEEASVPANHIGSDLNNQALKINIAISELILKMPEAQFYLFCTHKNDKFFSLLKLPANVIYIIASERISDPIDTLWLLSKCQHHIFTSSSYFWWGACLSYSSCNIKNESKIVKIIKNELNCNIKFDSWEFI